MLRRCDDRATDVLGITSGVLAIGNMQVQVARCILGQTDRQTSSVSCVTTRAPSGQGDRKTNAFQIGSLLQH
jgi:hypothetical protein